MLGLPLPPSYTEVVYPFCKSKVRYKPKTKGWHRKAGRDVAEKSASSASETPTDPVPQREPHGPRVEEADSGKVLVPLRAAEPNEAHALVRSLTRRLESLEDRTT